MDNARDFTALNKPKYGKIWKGVILLGEPISWFLAKSYSSAQIAFGLPILQGAAAARLLPACARPQARRLPGRATASASYAHLLFQAEPEL